MEVTKLSERAIKEYQEVYFNKFGIEIPYEEAQVQAQRLYVLMSVIYKPIKKEWLDLDENNICSTI